MKQGRPWIRFRHTVVHHLLYYPVKMLFFLVFGFRGERYREEGNGCRPYFILGNHTTPLDAVLLGTSFAFPVYYVASDHVLRAGWAGRLLKYLVAPIPIVKSRLDLQTIRDMMAATAQGGSVCLFPEGNRCYNGETVPFPAAVAKLARKLGATLLLYRFEGGYLTAPRWADTIRRGRFTGRVVRAVTPEEMEGMTVPELHALIRSELYENAFGRQAARPVRYRGKRLAESLERALYLCPRCLGMATMRSRDDRLACGCGLSVRYDETGFFKQNGGEASPFDTVLEWDRWQKGALPAWLEAHRDGGAALADGVALAPGAALAADRGQRLYACVRAGSNTLIGEGDFSMHADRFSFRNEGLALDFPLAAIDRVIIHGKQALQFTDGDGVTYEVKSAAPRSALKYVNLFNLLRYGEGELKDGFFGL